MLNIQKDLMLTISLRYLLVRLVVILYVDLDVTKPFIIECILYTLCKILKENAMENPEFMIPESYRVLIQKILSISREIKDGEMIHNLIQILVILAGYLEESKTCSLATSILNSLNAKKDHCEAFFVLLEPTFDQVYNNDLNLMYKLSPWKISTIYKALFKWLTNKIDTFSTCGVKFETLQSIFTATRVGPQL